MTREEAIEILRAESGDVSCNTVGVARWMKAIDMAISALRQQECVGDANKALTLDELREMDGEPIWVCFIDGVVMRDDGWFILAFLNETQALLGGTHPVYKNTECYGKTWLAYRKKPEEGTV